jgi:hypothetical protein
MRHRLVAAATVPFFAALAALAACAAPTEAIVTIQADVDCGEMSVEIYTGQDLAGAQKKAATPNLVPDAEFTLRAESSARPAVLTCKQTALENLGTFGLHPKRSTNMGAFVALVELKNSAAIGAPEGAPITNYGKRECATRSPLPANCLRIEATFAYQKNISRSFPLRISQACFGKVCLAGKTCFEGECIGTDQIDDKPVEVEAGLPDSGPPKLPPDLRCFGSKPVVNQVACADGACWSGVTTTCTDAGSACKGAALCCGVPQSGNASCCVDNPGSKTATALPYVQTGACGPNAKKACFLAAVSCASKERCDFDSNVGFGRCEAFAAVYSCAKTDCTDRVRPTSCINLTSGDELCSSTACKVDDKPCCSYGATNCCVQAVGTGVAPFDVGTNDTACAIGKPCFEANGSKCEKEKDKICRRFKTALGIDAGYGICE